MTATEQTLDIGDARALSTKWAPQGAAVRTEIHRLYDTWRRTNV